MAELGVGGGGNNTDSHARRCVEIMQSLRLLSVMLDAEGRVTYINDGLLELTGWTRAETVGKDWFDRFIPDDAPDVRALFHAAVAHDRLIDRYENDIVTRAGERRHILWHNTALRDAGGQVIGTASLGDDVTALRLDAQLLQRRDALIAVAGRLARVGGWEIDGTTRRLLWTDTVYDLFEAPPELPLNVERMLGFVVEEQREMAAAALRDALSHGMPADLDLDVLTGHARRRRVHLSARPEWLGDRVARVTGTVQDVTERWHSDQRYRAVLSAVLDGYWRVDRYGRLCEVNDAACAMLGYGRDELLTLTVNDIDVVEDPAMTQAHIATVMTQGGDRFESRHRRKDGTIVDVEVSTTYLPGQDMFCTFVRDVTARKARENAVWQQANFDLLTGLANRSLLADRLERALARARRASGQVGVIFLDLDGFKWINDSLGHDAGDELLAAAARRLREAVREQDTIARLGGDEFTVVAYDVADLDGLRVLAEKVVAALRAPYLLRGQWHEVTASAGVAVFPQDGGDGPTLMRHADLAMYKAKQAGKNRVQFFAEQMQADAEQRFRLEGELRRAIADRAFRLDYQPIVRADSGELAGAEALLRWTHPERGLVSPADFIPVAEESGLIVAIGEWALREAAGQWQQWRAQGHPLDRLAVNISGAQFSDSALPGLVRQVLSEHDIPRSSLTLEVTERALLESSADAEARMRDIHAQGIVLSIDDFGTGYSSLSYLRRFRVDLVKIDGSIVAACGHDADAGEVVGAIIAMAHQLGLKVVAEGVESRAQADFLRQRRCDFLQGHLISPPMAAVAFTRYLQRRERRPECAAAVGGDGAAASA